MRKRDISIVVRLVADVLYAYGFFLLVPFVTALLTRETTQVIAFGADTRVFEMELGDEQEGGLVLQGFGTEVDRAVLAISALAPATTEVASYEYSVYVE